MDVREIDDGDPKALPGYTIGPQLVNLGHEMCREIVCIASLALELPGA